MIVADGTDVSGWLKVTVLSVLVEAVLVLVPLVAASALTTAMTVPLLVIPDTDTE